MDQFYRFVRDREGRYTVDVTRDHADAWMRDLAQEDKSNAHKDNCQKAVKMLFKWREHGLNPWEPTVAFSDPSGASQSRDYLTREERKRIREVVLEYERVPAYNDLSPAARDRWKAHLTQRFEKSKTDVSPTSWDWENGWKIPSLV